MTEEQTVNDTAAEEESEDELSVPVNTRQTKIDTLEKTPVFAIGHPRSGTSVSCQLLETADDVEWLTNTGSDADQKFGYYEYGPFLSQSVNFLQEQWDITQADQVNSVLQTMDKLSYNPGCKLLHPHSWYNWKQFFQEDSKNLLIFREPQLSRKSIWQHKLNWPFDWYTTCNVQIGIYEDAENALLVRFKRLMQEPEKVADKVKEELDLEVDPGIVDQDEWHQKSSETIVGNLEEMVFDKLCELEEAQYE